MAPGWGAENVSNRQGTLGRVLIVPGGDGIQGRGGVPWASVADGSLLVSSTLGLAAKGGEVGRQRGKKGGGGRKRERERDLHSAPGPQFSITTRKGSLMRRLCTQAQDCHTHVPVGGYGKSPTQK